MPEAHEQLRSMVNDATVRIHGTPAHKPSAASEPDASELWGSGFFIAPSRVLTCAHIFAQASGSSRVWRGNEALRITYRRGAGEETATVPGRLLHCVPGVDEVPEAKRRLWPTPDLAVVELTEPVEHPCVWLSDLSTPPSGLGGKLLYGGWARDEYGSLCLWEGNSSVAGIHGSHVMRLDDEGGEIKAGLSGGPLVDPRRGAVVGVIKARNNKQGGGNCVRITSLRELSSAGALGQDPYQQLILAHDQWHWLTQRQNGVGSQSWATVQSGLPSSGRGWRPLDRIQALGLLAELPPAPDVGTIERLVDEACPGQRISGIAMPRSWRDGAGLLYDPHPSSAEKAVLSYLILVADSEYARAPEPAIALRGWALDRAASLPEADREELALLGQPPEPVEIRVRRVARIAVPEAVPEGMPGAEPGNASERADAPQAPVRVAEPEPALEGVDVPLTAPLAAPLHPLDPPDPFGSFTRSGMLPSYEHRVPRRTSWRSASDRARRHSASGPRPDAEQTLPLDPLDDLAAVLLEFRADWWQEDHYGWTVRLVGHAGDVELVALGRPFHHRELGAPPPDLLDALRQAFLRADAGEHVAPLEVLLPQELFDIPVDEWVLSRSSRHETSRLGVVRPVNVVDQRSFDRPATGTGARGAHLLWGTGRAMRAVPLLAQGDRQPSDVVDTVLFHSGPVGGGRAGTALRRVLDSGPAAVVWRREEASPELGERFAAEVGRLVGGIGSPGELPAAVAALRASLAPDDRPAPDDPHHPDSRWARGLAVLHDPEQRPAIMTDLLDTP
ncbi:trypsin-like peptidase domain-containing protein [Streptomyces sp. NBC_00878]|uniref:VMAP-C domain-containing protein n=1 Tax=Streptomyces sp. NBC_00878 TaxID=2975854 RepID=UPI00225160E1|nr:trypsin-like peptidase domain-containing protein [Streptomyces sp. NBC_00878]MCX4905499.1 trypsin-like peptidase domain-containing protein [Streptomyces sp. NBC_00878]